MIVSELNASGARTVKGKEFTINSLRHILHNRAYIGEYRWNDMVTPNGLPRLIDDATFEKVQKMFQENKRTNRQNSPVIKKEVDFWLTKKLVCGECGCSMCGTSGTGKHGELHYYYTCIEHRKHKCKKKSITKERLENIINLIFDDILGRPALQIILASVIYSYHKKDYCVGDEYLRSIESKLKSVERSLCNFLKAIEAGIFNDTTSERMHELEIQKKALQDELELEKNKKSKELTVDSILKFFHAHIKDLYKDKLLRAVVIDSFVKSILVYEDKVAVVLRYSDAPYSVTYEEIDARIKNRDKMLELFNKREYSDDMINDILRGLELYDSQNNSFFRFGVRQMCC